MCDLIVRDFIDWSVEGFVFHAQTRELASEETGPAP